MHGAAADLGGGASSGERGGARGGGDVGGLPAPGRGGRGAPPVPPLDLDCAGLAQVWQSVADAGVLAQIYAVEVVAPLFWSVGRLLSPSAAPPSATESGAPPQLLMCQSFPYDAATEAEMDRAAAAAGLERAVLADGLGGEGARERVKVQSFRRARSGNEP